MKKKFDVSLYPTIEIRLQGIKAESMEAAIDIAKGLVDSDWLRDMIEHGQYNIDSDDFAKFWVSEESKNSQMTDSAWFSKLGEKGETEAYKTKADLLDLILENKAVCPVLMGIHKKLDVLIEKSMRSGDVIS